MLRKYFRFHFTLIEMMVAMAVFLVISTLLLQFFAGAQKLWRDSESKQSLYSDARIAMDLMSNMLQSTYYRVDTIPFAVSSNVMMFAVRSPRTPGESEVFYVKITQENNNLIFSSLSDKDGIRYDDSLPPKSWTDICMNVNSHFMDLNTQKLTIVPRVTSLTFKPIVFNYSSSTVEYAPYGYVCPNAMEIRFSLLSDRDYQQWKDMTGTAADDFRLNNEKTFSRIVYMRD